MNILFAIMIFSLEDVTVFSDQEAAAGLDLNAVAQLVSEIENTEGLEMALNDPNRGINNLDLNEDGQVDYIRVVAQTEGNTHVFILQVPMGEKDFQDVATIQLDKEPSGDVILQIQGDVDIYGPDYYVVPATAVKVTVFPWVGWVYSPRYRPWVSPWHWHRHPHWWNPFRVVPVHVYRPRVKSYTHISVNVSRVNHVPRAKTVYKTRTVSKNVTKTTRKTVVSKQNQRGEKVRVAHTKKSDGTKKTVVGHSNPKTGNKQAIGVKRDGEGNRTVKAGKVKRTENKTTKTTVKSKQKKDGTKTKTKTKKTKKTKKNDN